MIYPRFHSLMNDFNLSIILPFYKKLKDFKVILPTNARYFQRNGIEVIIVMDEPSERLELTNFIKTYPLINWIIVTNEEPHEWRNPAKAINAGIKISSKEYIMICSPESAFHTDSIFILRYIAQYYEPCFTIGQVLFRTHGKNADGISGGLPYGSIMVKKNYLEQVSGYSEHFSQWGGEDNNIRVKLEYIGLKKIYVPDAILVHFEHEQDGYGKRIQKAVELPIEIKHRTYYPENIDYTNPKWGSEFFKKNHSYLDNSSNEESCKDYLRQFITNSILHDNCFKNSYKVIALIQIHNEKKHLPDVLKHLDTMCDGIILLDDESTDDSYELAMSDKLILKVQKKREGFDDLLNRNILLDLASFFNNEWLIFIDADERLYFKKETLYELFKQHNQDAYCFFLVHLWDSEHSYRCDVPEISYVQSPGVLHRWRAFKNKGRMQIISDRKLHFINIPFQPKTKVTLPVLIIHYGMIDRQIRELKYKKYLIEDEPDRHNYYSYFIDEKVILGGLDKLQQDIINKLIS